MYPKSVEFNFEKKKKNCSLIKFSPTCWSGHPPTQGFLDCGTPQNSLFQENDVVNFTGYLQLNS